MSSNIDCFIGKNYFG
jgi:hypothetical protein